MIVKCRVNPSRGFFLLRYSPLSKFSRSPSVLPILICHPHNHSSLALLGQKGDLANLFSLPIFQKLFSLSLSLLPLRRTSVEWIVLRTPHVGKYFEECTHPLSISFLHGVVVSPLFVSSATSTPPYNPTAEPPVSFSSPTEPGSKMSRNNSTFTNLRLANGNLDRTKPYYYHVLTS